MKPKKYLQESVLTVIGGIGALVSTVGNKFVKARLFHAIGALALFFGVFIMLLSAHGSATHGGGHPGGGFHVGLQLAVGATLSFTALALITFFWGCPACKQNLQDKFTPPMCPRCEIRFH